MYNAHFQFRENPFSITPDTSFYYAFPTYQRALNTLLVAAREGEGFIKITGEIGTGKTLLCRKFLSALGPEFTTAYIPNPLLSPRSLMLALADELQLAPEKGDDEFRILKGINERLVELAGGGQKVLLCIDEAQAMPEETLEALRLLSNLETEKSKLLQIVLFGQPELNIKLQRESIRQLNQRITFQYELGALDSAETALYVQHRVRTAGAPRKIFSSESLKVLHAATGGVPRLINIIAHKSLLVAFGQGKPDVSGRHIRLAATDTPASKSLRPPRAWLWAGLLLLGAATSIAWVYLS